MPKTILTEEVQVVRFFETGPLEKVEAVFNIVSEKMRERLQRQGRDMQTQSAPRRRNSKSQVALSSPDAGTNMHELAELSRKQDF